jgi:hypothetical protein
MGLMDPSPKLPDKQRMTRAYIAGALLGIAGILLFAVLWVVLESWGMDRVQRLIIAVCAPPALISLLIGAYLLIQPKNKT